jgi:hypothetical protein
MGTTAPGSRITLIVLATVLVGPIGCALRVAPAPATVRRVAVLPPSDVTGVPLSPSSASAGPYDAPSQSLAAALASTARDEIARQGFEIVDARVVEMATKGPVPSSPEAAAQFARSAKPDATALFMRVRRREFPYPTMRTNEVIVSLDAMLVDPPTGQVMWQVRRPANPVRLYGELIAGQADAVAAQEVMKEVFATLGQRSR